jgi:hypothetical protein
MSISKLGFVAADGSGGGLNEGDVLALIDQETATFVSNPDPPNVLNTDAIPTLVDPSGRIVKRSRVTITNGDELSTNKLSVGDGSYSFPTTIGAAGQILVVPTLGTELKFLNVDPSPVEVDDLQTKTQNISLALTTPGDPGETTFLGNVAIEQGLSIGLPDAADAWQLVRGHGNFGDQLLWPGGDSTAAQWGEAPNLTTVRTKTQNIYAGLLGVSTSFDGAVRADNGFLVGESPNDWKIATTRGLYGDTLVWPETGSTPTWSVPPTVQVLQEQCTHITSTLQTTSISNNLSGESIESRSTILVDSATPDGRYFLPYTRGTPGQVLTAAGPNGLECVFQDNVLTPNEADSLLEKTQFQSTDLTGTTFTGQLSATQNLAAPLVSAGHSVQINSDSLTGSYILPLNRGTPGQVLVAAGDEGESCEFQNAVVSPTDLTTLQSKTQNISLPTVPNVTNFTGSVNATNNMTIQSTLFIDAKGSTPGSTPAIEIGKVNLGDGYTLPRTRGLEGQGLIQGALGAVQFANLASINDLDTVLTRTQYQAIEPAFIDPDFVGPIPRMTSFGGGLQVRPTDPLSTDVAYNFPESKSGDVKTGIGYTLRTNGANNDLMWQKPIFISRYRRNVPGDFLIPFTVAGQDYSLMSTFVTERSSIGFIYEVGPDGIERIRYTGVTTVTSGDMSYNAIVYLVDAKGQPNTSDITFRLKHFKSSGGTVIVDVRRTNFTREKIAVSLHATIYNVDPGDYFRVTAESSVIVNLHADSQQINVALF